MPKTSQFQLTVGWNPGYGHKNEIGYTDGGLGRIWQQVADDVMDDYGVYPAGVVQPSRTVYPEKWGCPEGGELTVTVTGLANPHYVPDLEKWKEAVRAAADRLRKKFEQTTAYLTFQEVEFEYLRDQAPPRR